MNTIHDVPENSLLDNCHYGSQVQQVRWSEFPFAFAILLLCSLVSCGGSSTPKPLSVTLSPSSTNLGVNASVGISSQTNPPLEKYTGSMIWSIEEYQSSTRCTEQVPEANLSQPIANCPYGWLQLWPPQTGYTDTSAIYYSPSSAGIWHVTANASITNGNGKTEYQGSASAVVTVTNP